MALIKCPECGKEISDKSAACIHCGYPLNNQSFVESENSIISLFRECDKDLSSIYQNVIAEIQNIYNSLSETDANDKIALEIITGLTEKTSICSWANVKLFCELIKFNNLSPDGVDKFSEQIFNIISKATYYDDGSIGYVHITSFFYPTYMIMQYCSDAQRSHLMTILQKPYWGKQTGYEYISSMYNKHKSTNSMQKIQSVKNELNAPKCPLCGSTAIKKISTPNRLMSVATFGLASSKIGKQYECKSCKHKW